MKKKLMKLLFTFIVIFMIYFLIFNLQVNHFLIIGITGLISPLLQRYMIFNDLIEYIKNKWYWENNIYDEEPLIDVEGNKFNQLKLK